MLHDNKLLNQVLFDIPLNAWARKAVSYPRLRNIIPDISLGGRSSAFDTFVTVTLQKLTESMGGWQFLVVDPEYLFHYFKLIEGANKVEALI